MFDLTFGSYSDIIDLCCDLKNTINHYPSGMNFQENSHKSEADGIEDYRGSKLRRDRLGYKYETFIKNDSTQHLNHER